VKVGNPFHPQTQMGPLAMSRQRDRVESVIATGVQEGASLVTGGGRPKHLERGYFIEPTVFAMSTSPRRLPQEEIFGPVLSVLPAKDEDDAIRIATTRSTV
jgi:aldehyde dehydrogenase (NAD+)